MQAPSDTKSGDGALPPHLRAERTIADVRLSPWHRWPMLAILVTVFLFGGSSPVWRHPFDIDHAIWLSYAPIPLLVAACLWWSRRLSWLTLSVNTVEIVVLKFSMTYMIAMPLWAIVGPPPPPDRHPSAAAPSETSPLPKVTPWPDEQRGSIRGRVTNASGAALGGALVYVASGLDALIEPWPEEPRFIDIDAQGFTEPVFAIRRWQPLRGRALDHRMHTLFFEQAGRGVASLPLLASGDPTAITLDTSGIVSVRCAVHGESANALVLHHPYLTRSDAQGRFRLDGVPALPVTVSAWARDTSAAEVEVAVPMGATTEVTLTVTAPRDPAPAQ